MACTGDWVTVTTGSVHQRVGNEARNGPLAFLDPDHRIVGLHLYDGQLRISSIINENFNRFFNVRMEELNILDMCFLSSKHLVSQKPVVAVLYEDTRHVRHLKTYEVDLDHQSLEDAPWFQSSMINTAEMMIPVNAYGGLLLVGESMISYVSNSPSNFIRIPVPETSFMCYTCIDDHRWLMSDHVGHLYMLMLSLQGGIVEEVVCQRLGMAVCSSQ